jgi:N-acetylmuramoyl-L-alanine amidase
MIRARLLSFGICLAVLLASPSSKAGDLVFNTIQVDGKEYIHLADIVRYYQFDQNYKQDGLDIWLQSKYKRFHFKINSGEASINGVKIWLNDAPLESRTSILISEIDVRKKIDPLLRPWAIPRKKVRTIMIDPGHGGEDVGTLGYRGSQEKKFTLDVAVRVEKLLRASGFDTLMTRRRDNYVSLEDRSELANASDADIFVSIHFNSSKPNTQARGIETYCLTPMGLASTGSSIRRRLGIGSFGAEPGNQFDPYNMTLAYYVQLKLLALIPEADDRGIRNARFFVIKATERPSILIESGFLSNSTEEKRILTTAYREKLATGIVEGIKQYASLMNNSKKS